MDTNELPDDYELSDQMVADLVEWARTLPRGRDELWEDETDEAWEIDTGAEAEAKEAT